MVSDLVFPEALIRWMVLSETTRIWNDILHRQRSRPRVRPSEKTSSSANCESKSLALVDSSRSAEIRSLPLAHLCSQHRGFHLRLLDAGQTMDGRPHSHLPPSLDRPRGHMQSRMSAMGQVPHNDALWTPHGGDFPVDPLMTPKSAAPMGLSYPPLPSPTNAGLLPLLSARNPSLDGISATALMGSSSILSNHLAQGPLVPVSSYPGLSSSTTQPTAPLRAISCASGGAGHLPGSVLGKRPPQGPLENPPDSTLPALTGATSSLLGKQFGGTTGYAPGFARHRLDEF
jgi:hypothetical protein